MTSLDVFLGHIILSNTAGQRLLAILLFSFVLLSSQVFNQFLVKKIKERISGKHTDIGIIIGQLVAETPPYFFLGLALYLPVKVLFVPDMISNAASVIFMLLIALQLVRIASKLAMYVIQNLNANDSESDESSKNVLEIIAKILIWIIAIMLVMINLGIEITPLITSLGIGGIAIAFALQNILSDVFSSFSIFFDKPFKVGDFIILGEDAGTVTDITLKSTRIKLIDGPDLIVPNKEVTNTRINNYAHIQRRRVKQNLGVMYSTEKTLLKAIPGIVKDIVELNSDCSYKWCVFKEYGPFSLNFELVYFTEVTDYADHLSIVQDINYELFEKFAEHEIHFAFPTQTVHVKQD